MLFDDLLDKTFLERLDKDPLTGLEILWARFSKFQKDYIDDKERVSGVSNYVNAYYFTKLVIDKYDLQLELPEIDRQADALHMIRQISQCDGQLNRSIKQARERRTIDTILSESIPRYEAILGNNVSYTFSDDEIAATQQLINELSNLITKNRAIADKHRRRLLKRLKRLHAELHKTMSNFDVFLGAWVDITAALAKGHHNLFPILARFQRLFKIVCDAFEKAEGISLSLPLPSLPPLPEDDESDDQRK